MMLKRDTRRHRRAGAGLVAVASLALLVGCSVGPNYEVPEIPVPDQWENAAASDVLGEAPPVLNWWSAFGDANLDSLMVRARDANLDLAMAVARVSEARAYRAMAGGEYWPQVQASGQFARVESSENGVQGAAIAAGAENPASMWDAGLGASWEIDLFGRVRRTVESTDAQFEASIEDYRDVQVALYAEVAATYVNIRSLQTRLQFAQNNVESQRETMEIVMAREDAGLVPMLDVARARSNLANTEAAIPQFRTALEASTNRLSLLLGEHPGSLDVELAPRKSIPDVPNSVTTALPADLIRRRPDIRRAERQLAAQTARVGVATAALYPSFSLGGTLSLQATSFEDLGKSGSMGWSLVPGMQWNLFSGGKLRAQVKAEEAKVAQALAAYEKSVLGALAEVENSLVALEQEKIRQNLLQVAVEAAEESVTLVHIQYIEGLTDFQSYLDAQRVLFSQQDQYATSQGQVFIEVTNLNRAMGGGWSLDEPVPDLPTDESAAADAASDEEKEVNR